MTTQQEIKKLKKKIDSLRSLSKSELAELHKWYAVTYTYHSNALEGNTLTLGETKLVVEDGITVGGHPLREILEVKNHKEVIEELISIVHKRKPISESLIKRLHKILIKEIDTINAGTYRKIQVYITGEEILPPPAKKVSILMKEFLKWFTIQKSDSVICAAKAHYRFVKIHRRSHYLQHPHRRHPTKMFSERKTFFFPKKERGTLNESFANLYKRLDSVRSFYSMLCPL